MVPKRLELDGGLLSPDSQSHRWGAPGCPPVHKWLQEAETEARPRALTRASRRLVAPPPMFHFTGGTHKWQWSNKMETGSPGQASGRRQGSRDGNQVGWLSVCDLVVGIILKQSFRQQICRGRYWEIMCRRWMELEKKSYSADTETP